MFGVRKIVSGSMLNLGEVVYPDEDVQEAIGIWVRYSVKKSTPCISLSNRNLFILRGPTQRFAFTHSYKQDSM